MDRGSDPLSMFHDRSTSSKVIEFKKRGLSNISWGKLPVRLFDAMLMLWSCERTTVTSLGRVPDSVFP